MGQYTAMPEQGIKRPSCTRPNHSLKVGKVCSQNAMQDIGVNIMLMDKVQLLLAAENCM